jgi:hypothetical protein
MEKQSQLDTELFDFDSGEAKELLSLFEAEYGKVDSTQPEYLDWFCKENPFGEGIVPIVRDPQTRRIIGQQWFTPMRARITGEDYIGAIWANAIIHRDYRRSGVFKTMVIHSDEIMKSRGIDFGFGFPGPRSMPVAPKIHWRKLGQQNLMFRPLDWNFITTTSLGRLSWANRLIIPLAGFIWPKVYRSQRINAERFDLNPERLSRFDQAFDTFWERVDGKYPVMFVHDSKFLNWRYFDNPTRKYTCIVVREGDRVLSYIVIRSTHYYQIHAGFILDFLIEPSELGKKAGALLIDEAINHFRETSAQVVVTMVPSFSQEGQVLRDQGFAKVPNKLQPIPTYLHCVKLSDRIPDETFDNIDNWFLQLGDFDFV